MKKIVNSATSLSETIGILRETFKEKKYLTITINTGKGRTLNQNSISHAWYTQIWKELREHSEGEIKNLCKFHFGLPILRGTDLEIEGRLYNEICERAIDMLQFYEDRVAAMTMFPVTSLFNTEQFNRYLELIQINYAGRVDLQFPEANIIV